jgi:hypothetical protein
MKKVLCVMIFGVIFYQNVWCQMPLEKYKLNTSTAESLYHKGDYLNAAKTFSKAFEFMGWKGLVNDRYNAACCWALAGIPDSSFYQLDKIATNAHYSDLYQLKNEKDLRSLHADSRWAILLNMVEKNKEKLEERFNKPLVRELDTIFNDDQSRRLQLDSIIAKYGHNSSETQRQLQIMNNADSINVIKVTGILDKYGWPDKKEISERGSLTLFLVIQHADLKTQEKYLPLIEKACESGNLDISNLALIKDRILLRKGEKQIYGTQIAFNNESGLYFILPLSDPDNVDTRRKSIGLQPLSEYVRQWNIIWDPIKYKTQLPAIEEKTKSFAW